MMAETNMEPIDGIDLKFVQVVARHGARAPITMLPFMKLSGKDVPNNRLGLKYPEWNICSGFVYSMINPTNDISALPQTLYEKVYMRNQQGFPGTCGMGQLTQRGAQQHYEIGKRFRELYIKKHRLLSENLNPEELYVRSSDVPRTQESAMSLLLGLYPPETRKKGEIIPINTLQVTQENMYPRLSICPRVAQLLKERKNTEEWKAKRESLEPLKQRLHAAFYGTEEEEKDGGDSITENDVSKSEVVNINKDVVLDSRAKHRLEEPSGSPSGQPPPSPKTKAKPAKAAPSAPQPEAMDPEETHNTFQCFLENGLPLPHTITKDLIDEVAEAADWSMGYKYRSKEVCRLGIGRFVRDLVERMDRAKKYSEASSSSNAMTTTAPGGDVPPRFELYSGHDNTIVPLLSGLGVYSGFPPVASTVVLELYKQKETGDHFVRMNYNGKDLMIPGCKYFQATATTDSSGSPPLMCTYDCFRRACNEIIPQDYEAECKAKEEPNNKEKSNEKQSAAAAATTTTTATVTTDQPPTATTTTTT